MSDFIDQLRLRFNGSLMGITSRLVFLTEVVVVAGSFIIAIKSLSFLNKSLEISWNYILYGALVFMSWLALSQLTTKSIFPRTQKYRTLFFRYLQVSLIECVICTIIWVAIGLHSIEFILVPLYCFISFFLTSFMRLSRFQIFKHYRA